MGFNNNSLHFHKDDIYFWNQIDSGNCVTFARNDPLGPVFGQYNIAELKPTHFASQKTILKNVMDYNEQNGFNFAGKKFKNDMPPPCKHGFYRVLSVYKPINMCVVGNKAVPSEIDIHYFRLIDDAKREYAHKAGMFGKVATTFYTEFYNFIGWYYVPNKGITFKKFATPTQRALMEDYERMLGLHGTERELLAKKILTKLNSMLLVNAK
ncbi:MAG: hypothetical protein FWG80_03600 [Alphaproteobacteria bacterium]|nr:hypothetical protein [Alphaproteobacteria bacterium]